MDSVPRKPRRSPGNAAVGRRRSARPGPASGRKGFILGLENFETISSVEGIRLSAELKRDFREFDRQGLSAAERRRAIRTKYGRKPA